MGEYAVRNSDSQEIKIGTCENMYYLRFEDRYKVTRLDGNVDPVADCGELRFRLPFADEDDILPGEYKEYNRGLRLYKVLPCEWCKGSGLGWDSKECTRCHGSKHDGHEWFSDDDTLNDAGSIQLRHEASGLLLNVPCYHGMKLPDCGPDVKAFWNGKGPAFVLSSLRPIGSGLLVYPVVRCQFCDHAWRYTWEQVWDYIPADMRPRLEQYRHVETAA